MKPVNFSFHFTGNVDHRPELGLKLFNQHPDLAGGEGVLGIFLAGGHECIVRWVDSPVNMILKNWTEKLGTFVLFGGVAEETQGGGIKND